jgi:hypothetical protein
VPVHALGAELLEGDVELLQRVRGPVHVPHLGEVRAQVHERVHREARHVREVLERDRRAADPLDRVRLEVSDLFGLELHRVVERSPREVAYRHVRPLVDVTRLVPQSEDRDGLPRVDEDTLRMASRYVCDMTLRYIHGRRLRVCELDLFFMRGQSRAETRGWTLWWCGAKQCLAKV